MGHIATYGVDPRTNHEHNNSSDMYFIEALRVLLEAGSDVDHRDYDGCTALKHAAAVGSLECVQALLKHREYIMIMS